MPTCAPMRLGSAAMVVAFLVLLTGGLNAIPIAELEPSTGHRR